MLECGENLSLSLMVAVHEGAHFLDYSFENAEQIFQKEFDRNNISLLLTNLNRVKAPSIEVPSPYDIFEVLEKDDPFIDKIKNSEVLSYDYQEYILDQEMLSSENATYGLGSELNAYAHGTLLGYSILPYSDELENSINYGIPGALKTQRTGLIFFTAILFKYLNSLKDKKNDSWEIIQNSKELKLFYNSLINQSYQVLEETKKCGINTEYEKPFYSIFEEILVEKTLIDLGTTIAKDTFLNVLKCEEEL